jgi:hypothetical protein
MRKGGDTKTFFDAMVRRSEKAIEARIEQLIFAKATRA